MVRLVRPFHRYSQILRLLRRQRRQLNADLFQMQPRHFFVQPLRQRVDARLVLVLVRPQIDLRQRQELRALQPGETVDYSVEIGVVPAAA